MLAFSMIRAGTSVHHFVLAIPLILIAKKSMRNHAYYTITFMLSVTTLITMWGSIPPALKPTSPLNPYGSINNPATRFMTELYISDWFITLGTLTNTISFLWLCVEALHSSWAVNTKNQGDKTLRTFNKFDAKNM
jgi:hypothetical protein